MATAHSDADVLRRSQDEIAFVRSLLSAHGVEIALPSPIEQLDAPTVTGDAPTRLWIKRDDLISDRFPGNKFRKLVPHIARIATERPELTLTFGGAYSNHLYAFASMTAALNLRAVACVRGERVEPLNPLLAYVEGAGVQLHFLDRTTYGRRHDPTLHVALARRFGSFYLVPEGGTDDDAVRAVSTLASEVDVAVDHVVVAVGTGGTLAGLADGFAGRAEVIGVSALKGARSLDDQVRSLVRSTEAQWSIDHDHHFGGYARTSPELWDFIESFSGETGVRLDAVYTAKALIALRDRLRSSHPRPRAVLFVHTGGVPIDTNSALLEQGR